MSEGSPPLELWLPEIKRYVFENMDMFLEPAGFEFDKSDNTYRRTHGKNYEEFCFVFANQFPVSYRIGFLLQIWNHQIKNVKTGFPLQSQIENYKLRSLVLFMNHFAFSGPSQREEAPPNAYLLVTNKDLFTATDSIIALIQDQALPLADQLSELDGIDSFFADRPGWSVGSLNLNNITTELVAAKLNRQRDFHEVYQQIQTGIEEKIRQMEMAPEIKNQVAEFYKYLMNRNMKV